MTNTNDLNIEDEILPLFDFTFNYFSGQEVRNILAKPLGSKAEILLMQQVLKGFNSNREILKDYSFSRFNLSEIYDFFETFSAETFLGARVRWKLTFSEKLRHQKRGRLILLIHLFKNIYGSFVSRIDTKYFPSEYVTDLIWLKGFFEEFDLEHYELIIQKKKLRVRHIAELPEDNYGKSY